MKHKFITALFHGIILLIVKKFHAMSAIRRIGIVLTWCVTYCSFHRDKHTFAAFECD